MKILCDITVLYNGQKKTAIRSGIYFSTYNILLQLLENKNFEIFLYCHFNKNIFQSICNDLYPQYSLNVLDDTADLSQFDAFFSPVFSTPSILKNKPYITKFFILYDAIPLLKPEYFNLGADWFFELVQDINKNSYYFAISEHTKNDFLKYISNLDTSHIKTIHLAANKNFYPCTINNKIKYIKKKYGIPFNKKYILSLCTLEPRKNLIRALQAFIKFITNNNIKDMVYVLGGGHWPGFLDEIKKQIPEYKKYAENIIYPIGYIDDEDLSPLYSGANFFVYTSLYEGFGLPPLEAMQCGTPVITSNTTSIPEVVHDAALLIDPTSLDEHIQAFTKFYYNPTLREEYKKKGINRAKNFTWEKCSHIISNTIQENTPSSLPDITVITPILNNAHAETEYIINCIESVHRQNYQGNIEHIIVTDDTNFESNILGRYKNMKWIQIIHHSSTEVFSALNKSIGVSKGQYIAFLRPGSFYHDPNGLTLSIKALQNTKKECCTTDIFIQNKSKNIVWSGSFSSLLEGNYPFLDGILIATSSIKQNNFDISNSQNCLAKFLLNIAFCNQYIYSDHCFVTCNIPSSSDFQTPHDHVFLFYQYIGSKLNLNLADCIFINQHGWPNNFTAKYSNGILSKLIREEWASSIVKQYEKSNEQITNLTPIKDKDIFRYIKYKLLSYIYIGKREYYKKKYQKLCSRYKKITHSS